MVSVKIYMVRPNHFLETQIHFIFPCKLLESLLVTISNLKLPSSPSKLPSNLHSLLCWIAIKLINSLIKDLKNGPQNILFKNSLPSSEYNVYFIKLSNLSPCPWALGEAGPSSIPQRVGPEWSNSITLRKYEAH